MDEVFMNGDTVTTRYRQSAEYLGGVDDVTYWKTYATQGMLAYGFLDLANMVGITDVTSESKILSIKNCCWRYVSRRRFRDVYGREFELICLLGMS